MNFHFPIYQQFFNSSLYDKCMGRDSSTASYRYATSKGAAVTGERDHSMRLHQPISDYLISLIISLIFPPH